MVRYEEFVWDSKRVWFNRDGKIRKTKKYFSLHPLMHFTSYVFTIKVPSIGEYYVFKDRIELVH